MMSDGVVLVEDSSEKEGSDPIFSMDKKESDKTRQDDDDSNLTRRMTLVNLEVVSDGNENELSDDDDDEVIFSFLYEYG